MPLPCPPFSRPLRFMTGCRGGGSSTTNFPLFFRSVFSTPISHPTWCHPVIYFSSVSALLPHSTWPKTTAKEATLLQSHAQLHPQSTEGTWLHDAWLKLGPAAAAVATAATSCSSSSAAAPPAATRSCCSRINRKPRTATNLWATTE